MSIIDSNARWEDEDKAMQEWLDQQDAEIADLYDNEVYPDPEELAAQEREEQERREEEYQDSITAMVQEADNAREALKLLGEYGRTPDNVAAFMCRLMGDVAGEVYAWQHAADCFCGLVNHAGNYQNTGHALRFILDAVYEKMEKLGPARFTHKTQGPNGMTLVTEMRRTGPNMQDYEVLDSYLEGAK